MKRILFDMDGVLCAFDEDYERRTGTDRRATLTKIQKWALLDEHPFFFRDLPWMYGALAMFQFVHYSTPFTGYVPGICSAASSHIPASKEQKREWLGREIPALNETPEHVYIVNHREAKALLAVPGDILVDDHVLNVEEWRAADGISIFFEDPVQVIEELQKYLKTPESYFRTAVLFAAQNLDASIKLSEYAKIIT